MASEGLRAAAIHYPLAEDPAANRERLLSAVDGALADAALVVGPEAATAGVDGPAAEAAEPLDGPTVEGVRRLVERHGGTVVVGLPLTFAGGRSNAAVVVDGAGTTVHRQPERERTYDWATDFGDEWATPVEVTAGRMAVTLCADLDRPETERAMARGGATAVAAPANWWEHPDHPPLVEQWRARARALGRPVVVGNASRPDAGQSGPAAVVGPDGALATVRGEVGTATATLQP
jgi:predicted amidohydrolase